jgi:hypothetical protein
MSVLRIIYRSLLIHTDILKDQVNFIVALTNINPMNS